MNTSWRLSKLGLTCFLQPGARGRTRVLKLVPMIGNDDPPSPSIGKGLASNKVEHISA
jgi:hypothetical protein